MCVGETEIEEEVASIVGASESGVVPHSQQRCELREMEEKGTCVHEDEGTSTETQSVEEDQGRRSNSPTVPLPAPQKQRSLVSLFAKQFKKTAQSQIVPTTTTTTCTEQLSSKHRQTSLPSSSLPPAPKLSSVEDFVIGERVESPVLTPLERFRQRLIQQVTASQPPAQDHERGGGEESGEMVEGGGREVGEGEEDEKNVKGEVVLKPLISDDVISKLKDKPGERACDVVSNRA